MDTSPAARVVDLPRVQAERGLLNLQSAHDYAVFRRPDGGQVAYVAPGASVHPDRIQDWLESVRTELRGLDCDLIPVSRLPLTQDGRIDEQALGRAPLLDDEVARRWEHYLKNIAGVRDAIVMVAPEQDPPRFIPYADLFSEAAAGDHTGEAASAGEPSAGRPPSTASPGAAGRSPAISHGGELENSSHLPIVLGDVLQRAARNYPDHGVRIIDSDRTERFFAYPELLSRAKRLLGGLRSAGLQPGDRVLFQFAHNQDFITAFWACVLGGFAPVPLAAAYEGRTGGASALRNAWKMTEARLALTTSQLAAHLRAITADLPGARVECVDELLAAANPPASAEWHAGKSTDLALMMLTSGSTGVPKGVMLTHHNLIRRSAGSAAMNGFTSDMVSLNWMPLDHVAGIIYFHLRDVFLGCHQIHAATDLVLQDPLLWPAWVDRHRVTITFAPNFAFGLVNDRADELPLRARHAGGSWDLSCLRWILNGAEAIVPRTARRFLEMLAPYGLPATAMWPVWGMSETSSGTIYSDAFRLETSHDDDPFVEVGRPIPGFSIRIVGQNHELLEEGAVGSLEVKGDVVTAGYYNRPDLNAESSTPDGWFKTGDLGFLVNGRLTITGREKDVIIINSVNYPCHEIEGLVEEIAGIETSYTAACAVRDSGTNTDRLAIFFHPAAGCGRISPELIRTIRLTVSRRLGITPEYVVPVERDAIPKTNIGKIQRTQLGHRFAAGEFSDIIRRVEMAVGGANTVPDWFFQPMWRRAELRGSREIGPMLVFADACGVAECLECESVSARRPCLLVRPGGEFAEDTRSLTLDPANREHFLKAVEALARRSFEPASIVYLWDDEAGLTGVLQLVQTLRGRAMRLLAASRPLLTPPSAAAAMAGLLKTIPQENPDWSCSLVELPAGGDETAAALILRELSGHTRDVEVAYRGGERWVRRLQPANLPATPPRPLPIEKGGLYLLSGGLGGIGVEIARYLLKNFQAHLVLIGRREPDGDERRRAVLRSLEAAASTGGGSVFYAAVDVGNAPALREIVRDAEVRSHRNLNGVFHLAGVYHERTMAEETAAGMAELLHPKMAGTLALHQLVGDRSGALFVSFSSVNGLLGGYGVGAYAAANAFLENFSEYQRNATRLNAYCVSWSLWDDVGMSRGYTGKEAARGRGFYAISPRQGLSSFLAVLHRPPGHICVGLDPGNLHVRRLAEDLPLPALSLVSLADGDAAVLARLASPEVQADIGIEDRHGAPAYCRIQPATQPEIEMARTDRDQGHHPLSRMRVGGAAKPARPEGELETLIAGVWRDVLNIEEAGVTDNFFEIGGTSLAMAQINRRLQDALGLKIGMAEMFQYATVRTLAAHLSHADEAGGRPPQEVGVSMSRGERRREMARGRRRGDS